MKLSGFGDERCSSYLPHGLPTHSNPAAVERSLRECIGSKARPAFIPQLSDISEEGNYQVALIPLSRFADQLHTDNRLLADADSVVVLPVTWKDLVSHFRSDTSRTVRRENSDSVSFGTVTVRLSSMEVHRGEQPESHRWNFGCSSI
jgi:hypothetical protein